SQFASLQAHAGELPARRYDPGGFPPCSAAYVIKALTYCLTSALRSGVRSPMSNVQFDSNLTRTLMAGASGQYARAHTTCPSDPSPVSGSLPASVGRPNGMQRIVAFVSC